MKRPDCEFMRLALRNLGKPNQASRGPLVQNLMLESLSSPVISLWEKPFEQTEPGVFCKGRDEVDSHDQYELLTNWLYDDFVFLAQGHWTDYDTDETGPSKDWTYFIKNREAHPLCEALRKDALESSFMQEIIADPNTPESKVYETNPDHFYFALRASSMFQEGKWGGVGTLGIFCFWMPSPDDPMYSTTSEGEYQLISFPTKSTEDWLYGIGTPKHEVRQLEYNCSKQLLWVGDLHHYLKHGDRHAVEVLPNADKLAKAKRNPANRTRPWNTASGPHVLLLDRMPTTQSEGTGTHASPKPHRRRGHWKTLRHPRFRHHPQYQQKIYCKPSFVGPQQATYEGNIYRLVQPLQEIQGYV